MDAVVGHNYWFDVMLDKKFFSYFGKYWSEGSGSEVFLRVQDGCLFWNRYNIGMFLTMVLSLLITSV